MFGSVFSKSIVKNWFRPVTGLNALNWPEIGQKNIHELES